MWKIRVNFAFRDVVLGEIRKDVYFRGGNIFPVPYGVFRLPECFQSGPSPALLHERVIVEMKIRLFLLSIAIAELQPLDMKIIRNILWNCGIYDGTNEWIAGDHCQNSRDMADMFVKKYVVPNRPDTVVAVAPTGQRYLHDIRFRYYREAYQTAWQDQQCKSIKVGK